MKILVTGANGLVGSHFTENFSGNLKTEDKILLCPSAQELDITNEEFVKNYFNKHRPDVIIHFAAFTNLNQAELERNNKKAPCWMVNVEGTANLVKATNKNSYFIYLSTDNVFSGLKANPGPYAENYPTETNPDLLSWYGWTKREAEKIVSENLSNFAIIRISNPVRANYSAKLDYVRKILQLYDNRKLYPLFNDQYLTLTYINEVTECLNILLAQKLTGIYHISSTNIFIPFNLANFLIQKTRNKYNAVEGVSIERFLKENPARYPQYGGLKVVQTQKNLNLKFNSWQETIEALAKELTI